MEQNNLFKDASSIVKLSPATIAFSYVASASLWILFSDRLLAAFDFSPGVLMSVSILKGWVFVVFTGICLYFMVNFNTRKIQEINLKLRDMNRKLIERDEAVKLAQRTGGFVLTISRAEDLTQWSSEWLEMMGLPTDSNFVPFETFLKNIHQDDVNMMREAARTMVETGELKLEFRIIHPSRGERWIYGHIITIPTETANNLIA